jgi:hypothetical protein
LDLYDVDYSGSGHQPYHFDALAAIFDRFTVNTVRIEVEARNVATIPLVLLISPLPATTLVAGYVTIRELPHTK